MKNITQQTLIPSVLSLLLLLLTACVAPVVSTDPGNESVTAQSSNQAESAPLHNMSDGCVEQYDETVDYFPDKAVLSYGKGLTVEYFNHYKVVTVLNPWRGAEETFQYILVQCGTPAPDGYDASQIIEVPINRFVTLSTTILPGLDEMELLDRLVGVEEFDYVNTPTVRQLIDDGTLAEVSDGGVLNVELVLEQEPDLVMTFAYGSPEWDAHPKLLEAGLLTAIMADYMETSPLGRAEWMKFTALFFNTEAQAEAAFQQKVERYEELASLASNVTDKPTVLTGINRGDSWRVSGGQSYFARFLLDAGADYLWADDDSIGSIPLDFEVVFDRAAEADFWAPNTGRWRTLEDVATDDARYAELAAFQNGTIINNNASVNEFGGNDYFEAGVANPDLVLADLLSIFHPDLLPDHMLVFFRQIDE
ncbi:ABC transporter substrate-binding protein [Chloroflexi bacterium TSY]|nr:ABC transporter substrate-binding protein [Chloroflexi bacterium TSY]